MKKVILLSALSLAALSAGATKYVVSSGNPLGADDVLIPTSYYIWEGTYGSEDIDDATAPGGKAVKFSIYNDGWSGGGWCANIAGFDMGVFNNTAVDLVFSVKTTYTGDIKLQYNIDGKIGGNEPVIPGIERDGQWHQIRLRMNDFTPAWIASIATGDQPYVFAPVTGGGAAGAEISYADIYYEVTGESAAPRAGGTWYGTAEKDGFELDYALTANEDGTLAVEANVAAPEGLTPGYQVNINGKYISMTDEDGTLKAVSEETFEIGAKVPVFFYFAYTGGASRFDVADYVFGSFNEKPVKAIAPVVKASAENVTTTSADIAYTVTLPEELTGAAVELFINGEPMLGQSPYALTGLLPQTAYSYTIVAKATLAGETYESKPVTVSFNTLRDASKAYVWHTIIDAFVKNAYLVGEDPGMRRDIPISIEVAITYNLDGTISFEATPHNGDIVGIVPLITACQDAGQVDDHKDMTVADGKWTYTTIKNDYVEEKGFGWLNFQLNYDGGSTVITIPGYKVGDENDGAAYGAPANIAFTLSQSTFSVGQTAAIAAIVTDAAGHFLFDEEVVYALDNDNFYLSGPSVTAAKQGKTTLSITAGEITVSAEVSCITTADAERLIGTAQTDIEGHNCDLVFDGNEGTQIEWAANETEEHFIKIDLGEMKHIQAITLVWEGASAKEYTVALEGETQAAFAAPALEAKPGHVFTVTNGDGGAGKVIRENLYLEDFQPIAARYVTINTTKAYEPAWGIKLKEVNIQGVKAGTSGIEDIAAEADAPVEYFNLQGVRVANPEAGAIYIMRQGSKVTKVIK